MNEINHIFLGNLILVDGYIGSFWPLKPLLIFCIESSIF
jgi:hypothetical protein